MRTSGILGYSSFEIIHKMKIKLTRSSSQFPISDFNQLIKFPHELDIATLFVVVVFFFPHLVVENCSYTFLGWWGLAY